MSIKLAIFTVESLAHMQGREKDMLPIVEAARKEHEALLECVEALRLFTSIYFEPHHRAHARAALKKLENLK